MAANYRIKGLTFRAALDVLEKRGAFEKVRAAVSAETARLMAAPPLPASWVESPPLEEIFEHLEPIVGASGLRQVSRDMAAYGGEGMRFQAARAIMRLIGVSPHAIFARMNDFLGSALKGVDYTWEKTGDKRGVLTVAFTGGRDVPLRLYTGFIGAFEVLLKLANTSGHVGDPVRKTHNSVTFAIDWQ